MAAISRVHRFGVIVGPMLIFDNDDELPEEPTHDEIAVSSQFARSLQAIDDAIRRTCTDRFKKVAAIVCDAMRVGDFSVRDERLVRLHVRRVIELVDRGELEAQGDLLRPRFSEVRRRT